MAPSHHNRDAWTTLAMLGSCCGTDTVRYLPSEQTGTTIELVFTSFNLGAGAACGANPCDTLSVYDGDTDSAPLIGTFSGEVYDFLFEPCAAVLLLPPPSHEVMVFVLYPPRSCWCQHQHQHNFAMEPNPNRIPPSPPPAMSHRHQICTSCVCGAACFVWHATKTQVAPCQSSHSMHLHGVGGQKCYLASNLNRATFGSMRETM